MGKAFRDPEGLEFSIFRQGFKVESGPLAEIGRVAAEIDGYIPNVAGEDADELPLRLAELVVKSAEDALSGKGLIVLNELTRESGGREGTLVENFREPTATIAKAPGLNQFDIEQRGIKNLHPSSLSSGGDR